MIEKTRADHLPSNIPIRYWVDTAAGGRQLKDLTLSECVRRLTSALLADSAEKPYWIDETNYPWWIGFGF